MGLKLIGAGLPRTGTTSLREALSRLGIGATYHLGILMEQPEDLVAWKKRDWNSLFDGVQPFSAALDYPACFYWKALAEAFPEAKVILTTRNPAAWVNSVRATIYARTRNAVDGVAGAINRDLWCGELRCVMEDPAIAAERFSTRNLSIEKTLPSDRLLIYDVASGWEPLCSFLQQPVPDATFPHLNQRSEFL